jgi:hypothetical protein
VFWIKTAPVDSGYFEANQLKDLIDAWQTDIATRIDPPPYLLVIMGYDREWSTDSRRSRLPWWFRWRRKRDADDIVTRYLAELRRHQLSDHLLAAPDCPSKNEFIDWADRCIPKEAFHPLIPDQDSLRNAVFGLLAVHQEPVPHWEWREKLMSLFVPDGFRS